MRNIKFVMELLDKQLGVSTGASDFGYESVTLDRSELDTDLLPGYFDEIQTDETLLIHFYNVGDYIVYIVADVKDSRWCLVGILKSGKLAYSRRFDL